MTAGGAVAVAGEALVDLIPQLDGRLAPVLGGGPFNTARALARLGRRTTFVGAISRDAYGRRLAHALASDGVSHDDRLRSDRPTSLAMAEIDPAGVARYRFYFAGTSAEHLEPDVALAALPTDPAALHVGGLGLVLEPLALAVEAMVERLTGRALVMLDPNVRPSVIADPQAHAARLDRLIGKADVVKVSEEDLAALSPGVPAQTAAAQLLSRGPGLVLLTLGGKGAIAIGRFGSRAVCAPPVRVIDTIGAGDTFSAAWLAQWLEGSAPLTDGAAVERATAFACRAASVSCASAGASPPTRAQVEAWSSD